MKRMILALVFVAVPLAAQNQALGAPVAEGGTLERATTQASQTEDKGGLSFTVTDESEWADLGVAIPAFATHLDTQTPANSHGISALGGELARVIKRSDEPRVG